MSNTFFQRGANFLGGLRPHWLRAWENVYPSSYLLWLFSFTWPHTHLRLKWNSYRRISRWHAVPSNITIMSIFSSPKQSFGWSARNSKSFSAVSPNSKATITQLKALLLSWCFVSTEPTCPFLTCNMLPPSQRSFAVGHKFPVRAPP